MSDSQSLESILNPSHESTSDERYRIFFDGACDPNPGQAAYGVSVTYNGKEIMYRGDSIGLGTNNIAEYHGIINALLVCIELNLSNVTIYGDSLLVINQVQEKWNVKNKKLKVLCQVAIELLQKIPDVKLQHIERTLNSRADFIANSSLQKANTLE